MTAHRERPRFRARRALPEAAGIVPGSSGHCLGAMRLQTPRVTALAGHKTSKNVLLVRLCDGQDPYFFFFARTTLVIRRDSTSALFIWSASARRCGSCPSRRDTHAKGWMVVGMPRTRGMEDDLKHSRAWRRADGARNDFPLTGSLSASNATTSGAACVAMIPRGTPEMKSNQIPVGGSTR